MSHDLLISERGRRETRVSDAGGEQNNWLTAFVLSRVHTCLIQTR